MLGFKCYLKIKIRATERSLQLSLIIINPSSLNIYIIGMKQFSKLSRAALLSLVIVSLLSTASANDSVINLEGNFSSGTEHTIIFSNQSNIDDPKIKLNPPNELEEKIEMNSSNDMLKAVLPPDLIQKGAFKYYIQYSNGRLPKKGYFTFSVGSGNESLFNESTNLADKRPSNDPHCSESGDFACELEHYQASMMIKHIQAYDLTEDSVHLNKALNFSTSPYGSEEDREIACRHETNSFDCFSGAENPTGPVRQGSLIQGLWTVYSKTGEPEVKNLATNYTESEFGNESCDVWDGKYECGTGKEMGYLANGFWKAYETTGKQSYKDIARNLTVDNQTHPRMVEAHARALKSDENKSNKDSMEKMFDNEFNRCISSECNTIEELQLSIAGFEAYKTTGEQGFYSGALQVRPGSCEDNICDTPQLQGLNSVASLEAYASFKDERSRFFNPRILEYPSQNETLRTSIDFNGVLSNSKAILHDLNGDNISSCNLSIGTTECSFGHEWQDQQMYYISFNSDEISYPDNGSIPVAYTQVNSEFLSEANQLSNNPPNSRCNPFEEDYSCVSIDFNPYELDQSSYISGFSTAYEYSSNQTYLNFAESLSTPPYHHTQNATEEDEDLCIPDQNLDGNEYRCDSFDNVFAGERQGALISSLFSSYSLTENQSILYEAENYATSSVAEGSNDCDVWNDGFECIEDSNSQAAMIDGYWTAYRTTGNSTYREIAENLTDNSLDYPDSYRLASSLWKAYSFSGKEPYSAQAKNMTRYLIENRTCAEDCELEEYINRGKMYISAYKASGNESYIREDGLERHFENRTKYDCITEGECSSPYLQGQASSLMTEAAHSIPISVGLEREINVSSTQITVGDNLQAQCYAENVLQNTTVSNLNLNVTSGPELGNETFSYDIGDLEYNDTNTTEDNFTALESGESEVSCEYTATEINRTSTQTIEINPEDTDDSDDTDDDSSSDGSDTESEEDDSAPAPDSSQDEEKVEKIYYNFDHTRYNYTELGLDDSYKHYNIYSDGCISASRTFEDNQTILTINQSCRDESNIAVRDRINESIEDELFFNTGSEENKVIYPFNSDEDDWSKPEIAIFYQKELEIKSDISESIETDEEVYTFNLSLNRPEECTVSQNQSVVFEGKSISHTHNISLHDGVNHIEVECDTVSESFSVKYEAEDKDTIESIWIYLIPFGLLILLPGALGIYYRQRIIGFGKIKIFDFYFDRVMKAVENGNTDAAINNYKKMNTYGNFPEMNSDLDVQEGLKLYMMIDLVSDAGMEIGDAELVGDVKTSLGQYLTQNPDSPLARHIKSKIKNM